MVLLFDLACSFGGFFLGAVSEDWFALAFVVGVGLVVVVVVLCFGLALCAGLVVEVEVFV